jgi:hypothetical protein
MDGGKCWQVQCRECKSWRILGSNPTRGKSPPPCLHNVQTGSGTHTDSCLMGTWVLSQRRSGQGVKLTTYLHLLPKIPLYVSVAQKETA